LSNQRQPTVAALLGEDGLLTHSLMVLERIGMKIFPEMFLYSLLLLPPPLAWFQVTPANVADTPVTVSLQSAADENIPIGTVITAQNWQGYKQYMSEA
jgi:hypothetical protein